MSGDGNPERAVASSNGRLARAYADWLRARSVQARPTTTERREMAAAGEKWAAIDTIAAEQATDAFEVFRKIEVLHELLSHDGQGATVWTAFPEIMLLASISRDLMVLGVGGKK